MELERRREGCKVHKDKGDVVGPFNKECNQTSTCELRNKRYIIIIIIILIGDLINLLLMYTYYIKNILTLRTVKTLPCTYKCQAIFHVAINIINMQLIELIMEWKKTKWNRRKNSHLKPV